MAEQAGTPYFTLAGGAGPWPWFSHQHDVEFDGANFELFDNGNTRVSPPPLGVGSGSSRGQVYSLDETAMVATQLLSAGLGRYSDGFGSAQLLANGDYWFTGGALVNKGAALDISDEVVTANPTTVSYSLRFPTWAYRTFRLSSLYGPTQLSQTIAFGPLSNQPLGTAPFTVGATAASGLTVTFSSQTPAVCTVSGTTVTLLSVGQCTIQANQAGNVNWTAATPVSQSFQVT